MILTFLNPQEEFIKMKLQVPVSLTLVCVIGYGVVEGQEKTWIICFVFEMVGGPLISSWMCSTLPSPWPMIIRFQLTVHIAFASFFFFFKTFSHLL